MRIGIFGHYGNGNLGDEAITEAAIESARRILGAEEIRLFSIVPEDSAERHNLDAFPIRRGRLPVSAGRPRPVQRNNAIKNAANEQLVESVGLRATLKRSKILKACVNIARSVASAPGLFVGETRFLVQSHKAVRDLDLMIIAGSNQYLDNFGGIWGFPYTLLKWTLLCRSRGTKVVFLSIGAGPIDSAISRMMVRLAIRMGHYHSYRDDASLALIEGPNARLGGVVYPDLACNLTFEAARLDPNAPQIVVAINPMPVYGDYWFVKDEQKYLAYVTKLAEFIVYLDSRNCRVVLFPTQTRDEDAIDSTIEILTRIAPDVANKVDIDIAQTSQDVMRIIQSADVIVPTRFHGAVLGILAKRMVIGICYQAKAFAVLAAAGQQDYAFMLDEVIADDLKAAFDRLLKNRKTALKSIEQRSKAIRKAIEIQYHEVAGILK